jgi:hypothetical protein
MPLATRDTSLSPASPNLDTDLITDDAAYSLQDPENQRLPKRDPS